MSLHRRSPTHHPDDGFLIDYASGGLVEPAALVVATHLALCPGCRQTVEELEAVGGALLDAMDPDPVSSRCLDQVLARLNDAPAQAPSRGPDRAMALADDAPLPRPLGDYLGGGLTALRWRTLMPGLRVAEIGRCAGTAIKLVRMAAGTAVPRHSHEGTEFALILQGGFTDAFGHYQRGDLAVGDESVDHQPRADGDGCLCLSVTLGRLRLTGALGRLVNPFVRI